MQKDKIVEKITDVDYEGIEMPMYAVYVNPDDYPGRCAARLFDMDKATNVVIIKGTLDEMQEYFSMETNFTFFRRGAGDVPQLAGVWL